MTALLRSLVHAVTVELAVVISRTADLLSAAFDTEAYEGTGLFVLSAGAATAGSSPTLDVKLTHCDTSGGTYTDVPSGAFAQVTTVAGVQALAVDLDTVKRYVKVVGTLGGTSTPTFPYGIAFTGLKKYT